MSFNAGYFGNTTSAPAKKKTGFDASAFASVKPSAAAAAAPAPAPASVPADAGVTKKKDIFTGKEVPWHGNFGPGLQTDVIGKGGVNYPAFDSGYSASFKSDEHSGRPLLQRDTPDRRSTDLLPDRTAATFDITKPQKLTREVLSNPRMPKEASDAIRRAYEMGSDEQLDHSIPLQGGGSNDKSNLRPVKEDASGRQPLVGLENQLGWQAIRGEISVQQLQREIAKAKGIQLPDAEDLPSVERARRDETPTAVQLFPATMHSLADLQVDPLNLKADPSKFMETYLHDMGDAATQAAVELTKFWNPKTSVAGRVAAFLSGGAKTINAALSPVTALFSAAGQIPVVGTAAKLIGVPFAFMGDLGHDAAEIAGKTVLAGLPEKDRQQVVDGLGEVFALAGQIWLGAKAEGTAGRLRDNTQYKTVIENSGLKNGDKLVRKYGLDDPVTLAELQKRYGPTDTQTIVDKAYEVMGDSDFKIREAVRSGEPTKVDAAVSEVTGFERKPAEGGFRPVLKDEVIPAGYTTRMNVSTGEQMTNAPSREGSIEVGKYKSADEFVNSQAKVYRGATPDAMFKDKGRGLSFATTPEVAERFAKQDFNGFPKKGGVVEERYLAPGAKVLDPSTLTAQKIKADLTRENIFQYAKDNGFDAIDFSKTTDPKLEALGYPKESELRILNPEVLKTKEDLVKLYDQAAKAAKRSPGTPTPGEFKSRVYERMRSEHPEVLQEKVGYRDIDLKKDAEKAVDLIEKDKEQAYRVAMGVETLPDQTSTAVNIALAEKALDEGNYSLYGRLVKNRSLEQTRRGQELVAEKGSIKDNSTARYVKDLLAARLEKLGDSYLSDLKDKLQKTTRQQRARRAIQSEVERAVKRIESTKEMDLAAAQKLIDSLTCA